MEVHGYTTREKSEFVETIFFFLNRLTARMRRHRLQFQQMRRLMKMKHFSSENSQRIIFLITTIRVS